MNNSKTDEYYFRIDGIICFACVSILENAAKALPGVYNAAVNFVSGSMKLTTGDGFDPRSLIEEVSRRGYRAVQTAPGETYDAAPDMKGARLRLLLCFGVSAVLWLLTLSGASPYLRWICATAILIIGGRSFVRDAAYSVASGSANMSVLVAVGTLAAYIMSAVSVVSGFGEIYFEAAGTAIVFVMIGKYLENSAKISSSESIRTLMKFCPETAEAVEDGVTKTVKSSDIRTGMRIHVARNSMIPTDGRIAEGSTHVDESSVTGESEPAARGVGDTVYCGTVNRDRDIEIVTECDYADNLYCRMLAAILRCMNGERTRVQRVADAICSKFVVFVLLTAAAALFAWFGFIAPGDLSRAVVSAVSVLIVACPCAMGIATPLSVAICVGQLGKSGIIVKNPAALETLAKVDTVVFDKTGTLTCGENDEVREGAPVTVQTLKGLNIGCVILSGDGKERVDRVAELCGIDERRFSLKPEDKGDAVRRLMQNHTVAMVGDGVNDLLPITAADVGISIGRAADLNLESSDLIITRNKIAHLLKAVYISRIMLRNIRSSLIWALLYNIVGIAAAFCGVLTPVYAGLAMSLSSAGVVINSYRLEKQSRSITFEKILKS